MSQALLRYIFEFFIRDGESFKISSR